MDGDRGDLADLEKKRNTDNDFPSSFKKKFVGTEMDNCNLNHRILELKLNTKFKTVYKMKKSGVVNTFLISSGAVVVPTFLWKWTVCGHVFLRNSFDENTVPCGFFCQKITQKEVFATGTF